MMKLKVAAIVFTLSSILLSPSIGADKWTKSVRTIDWSRFKEPKQVSDAFMLSSKINANAARYTHAWAPEKYETSKAGDYFVFPAEKHHLKIRPGTSAALGLAVTIKTGIDPKQVGSSKKELTTTAVKLIKGAAVGHRVNGGTWGSTWQSSLMGAQLGRAAWLMWDDLDADTQEMACKVMIYEANRFIHPNHRVRYWNGEGGDSKSEENSWDTMSLFQALAMLPDHPNAPKWKAILCELLASAYSRPSDMERTEPLLDGKSPKEWLKGYNVREDGIVINHGLIHNDYMTSISHLQMSGLMVFSLAGIPAPESTDFNFDVIYKTLATKKFDSPPFKSPGGTMYIPGSPEQYYPKGTDWSKYRYACFYGMDALADVFGHDRDLPHKAAGWEKLRGERIFEMQSRHTDGHMYAPGEWENYKNREFMIYWAISDVQLLRWLADRDALTGKANLLAE